MIFFFFLLSLTKNLLYRIFCNFSQHLQPLCCCKDKTFIIIIYKLITYFYTETICMNYMYKFHKVVCCSLSYILRKVLPKTSILSYTETLLHYRPLIIIISLCRVQLAFKMKKLYYCIIPPQGNFLAYLDLAEKHFQQHTQFYISNPFLCAYVCI